MRVTVGRGNSRQVIEVPTGSIVRNAPADEQKTFIQNMTGLILRKK